MQPERQGFDLVTGGGGFIGSHLVDALIGAGRRVRIIDNFASGRRENLAHHTGNPHVEIIEADIGSGDDLRPRFEGVERVFHLAALADIVPSIQRPQDYFSANVDGTFAVVQAAAQAGVQRFVYTASSSCYGLPDLFPTPESAPIDCRYPYALTKMLGEQIALHWAQVYKLPVVSLRLFNVYGPRSRTTGTYGAVFGVFLAQLLAGKPLTIVGDGTQTRDFTFVSDVVDAFLAAAERGPSGAIYNVGSGRPVSVNRLAELLGSRETVHIPKRPGEPDCTHADVTRIGADLAWRARISIEQGVRVMLDHIENWRNAPVWTSESIATATADWFKFLGQDSAPSRQTTR